MHSAHSSTYEMRNLRAWELRVTDRIACMFPWYSKFWWNIKMKITSKGSPTSSWSKVAGSTEVWQGWDNFYVFYKK